MKYILYARKSTEDDKRQVQSIESQTVEMTRLAVNLGLNIVKTFEESRSAKKPNNRPQFSEMIRMIEAGEADGIICWKIDRLSRNPVDSGTISWLLQQGKLKVIQTSEKQYLPSDNIILLSLESSMANQYNLDLSKNVKRGVKTKLERGEWINHAPFGYKNNLLTKKIEIDEYNRIQELLGLRGCKKRPHKHDFIYSGLFKCGVCGCGITAEHKTKYIKGTNEVRGYDYYHCTHKKVASNCRQGSVEESDIKDEILGKLDDLAMNPLYLEWALDYLDSQKGQEKAQDKQIEVNKAKRVKEIEEQLAGLTIMRTKNLLDDEEFMTAKTKLKTELEQLNKVDQEKESEDEIIELTKEKFIFACYAKKKFDQGTKGTKKEVLVELGSNRQIIDKKVLISVNEFLEPIIENVNSHNAELARLEPSVLCLDYRKSEALTSLNLSWLGDRDSNPN